MTDRLSDERLAEIRAWMAAGRYHGLREVLAEVDRLRATEAELHRLALASIHYGIERLQRVRTAVLDRCSPEAITDGGEA